ncbi:2-oxoacid:acceptor oxidoreductase subunit alpha, partial [Candidatus Cerribacteria bacterium 'Amazon FNV 2010 28 9']
MVCNWKIAGRAGEGISAAGFMMGKTAQRHGLNIFEYSEYPSLIRGGHTSSQVLMSDQPVSCQQKDVSIMVALNEDSIRLHTEEFTAATKILLDTDTIKIDWSKYPTIQQSQVIHVPFAKIARDATGKSLASDIVALAVSCSLIGLSKDIFEQVVKEFFEKKGEEVVAENIKAAESAFAFANEQKLTSTTPIQPTTTQSLYISGAEAIGLGALSAGVKYFAAYPMTPTSNLMHFMADAQNYYPLIVKHAEDEISAINHALGASFTGVRAMTGTAGGGFALMVESVSLAGVTELPL